MTRSRRNFPVFSRRLAKAPSVDASLQRFISALRMAEVRISPAETLDAFRTVDRMGMEDRQQLKESLALVLPKTAEEKLAFDACFDAFFRFEEFSDAPPGESDGEGGEGGSSGEGEGSEGQGGGGDGQPQGQGSERPDSDASGGDPSGDGPPDDDRTDPFGDPGPGPVQSAQSALGQQLQQGDRAALALAVSQAGEAVNVAGIKVFTQKGLYTRRIMDALGQGALQEEIGTLAAQADATARRTAAQLSGLRDDLRERVRDYVERQFLLHADADGHRLREAMLRHVKLSNVEHRNFSHLKRLVEKMAKRLIAAHSRRRKKMRRGQLHVSRTLRKNLRYDGELIDLAWKARKIDRSKVFAICDVSGSVATYARFMLMFLYSLEAVLPRVRAFAFSSDLGEVTENFQRMAIDDAIATTLADFSGGSTDYGQAFDDFLRVAGSAVNSQSTVIILGDARNNYGNPNTKALREIYDKAQRVIWLNPEPERSWGSGDSEMPRYRASCHQVNVCNALNHLERVISDLLIAVR